MTGSHRIIPISSQYLLVVLCIVLLQACSSFSSHTPETISAARAAAHPVSASEAVPILLTVPAARVQRVDAADVAATKVVDFNDEHPQWIFESAKDGSLPAGAILPLGIFSSPEMKISLEQHTRSTDIETELDSPLPEARLSNYLEAKQLIASVKSAPVLKVLIYASPTTTAYFAALGVDYQQNLAVWQDFLTRHDILFEVVKDVDVLVYHRSPDVLLLPSAVALNDAERNAIQLYRKRGGAVLATWLSGVRGPLGEWTGFGFMSGSLNTTVVGDTSADKDDVYINPYGDSPVTHQLPAGLRIWTARSEGWYPLRLAGVNSAASIVDWSRNVSSSRASSVISYNERVQANGLSSRAVVLGYPERTWLAADPVAMDAIAYDALSWVARRPAAYLGTWPAHHRSALLMALDESNGISANEDRYAKLAEKLAGHATYFVLTQQLADAHAQLKALQARGHEVAYLGDRFESYHGLQENEQQRRIEQMLGEIKDNALQGLHQGFHAPMEGYDQVTMKVLAAKRFRYMIGDPGVLESRLPAYATEGDTAGLLVLPRTQSGPDDVLGEGHDFKDFLAEFSLSERMGGLNVIRIPSASAMQSHQWEQFSVALRQRDKTMWVASGLEVADWWQERSRVRVSLDSSVTPAMLTVDVGGQVALQQPVTVMVNLPSLHAGLTLLPDDGERAIPVVIRRDVWRADVVLGNLPPGSHHWFLRFDEAGK
jgi:hypothetical protein